MMLALSLGACSPDPLPVTIAPRLACGRAIECHVYSWRLALPLPVPGPLLQGTHINCQCEA
jgi:hypothetical protein